MKVPEGLVKSCISWRRVSNIAKVKGLVRSRGFLHSRLVESVVCGEKGGKKVGVGAG